MRRVKISAKVVLDLDVLLSLGRRETSAKEKCPNTAFRRLILLKDRRRQYTNNDHVQIYIASKIYCLKQISSRRFSFTANISFVD